MPTHLLRHMTSSLITSPAASDAPLCSPARPSEHPRRHGPVYCQDAALAAAALVEEEPDDAETAAFCAALSGHQGRPFHDVRDELADLRMPRGFRHVRLLISGEDRPFQRITRRDMLPVSVPGVLFGARRGLRALVPWSSVEPLDVVDRGVLDLAITYVSGVD